MLVNRWKKLLGFLIAVTFSGVLHRHRQSAVDVPVIFVSEHKFLGLRPVTGRHIADPVLCPLPRPALHSGPKPLAGRAFLGWNKAPGAIPGAPCSIGA